MKRLESVENDQVQLEVIECDCGFHIGIDATYLVQVGDLTFKCPACGEKIDTEVVCPEDDKNDKDEWIDKHSVNCLLWRIV